MAEKDNWITIPTAADDGRTVIVTANTDVARFRSRPRYCIRIEITLPYRPDSLGFPADDAEAEMLEKVTDAFHAGLKGQNTAIMTGIYTGAGERNWIFYAFSTNIFNSFLNRALGALPLLPLHITAENDPDWAEYDEMTAAIRED